MPPSFRPAFERGRQYAFPVAWAAIFAVGVGLTDPVRSIDVATGMAFAGIGSAQAHNADAVASFARPDLEGRDDTQRVALSMPSPEDHNELPPVTAGMGHGRFAAPGNAVRRQVRVKPINPRTADELAGFLREASYTLNEVRQGEAVPAIKVERVPADLGNKDGNERKLLFISAILPVVLETNHRVLVDREKLVALRDKMAANPDSVTALDRVWLEDLAQRYEAPADQLDELLRRVDIVPPSMAIAQGGVESGWGTSVAARTGNALYGQMQAAAFLQRRRGDRGLHRQPQHPPGLCRLPHRPRRRARPRRAARGLPPGRHAVALLRARHGLRPVRPTDHARERPARFRPGAAARGVELLRRRYIIGRGRSASAISG